MPLLTQNVFGAPGHQQPNFDGFVYIHYAAPSYSARISASYLLQFGKVWLGSVCRVQRLGDEAERKTYGGRVKSPVQFSSICLSKFTKYSNNAEDPSHIPMPLPGFYVVFRSEDIRH